MEGEITPVSVTQSSTRLNDETEYGAHRAIDKDLDTHSYTQSQTDPWFKARLDMEYCITRVVQYVDRNYLYNNTYTCSQDTCSCEGLNCPHWSLSVYREDGTLPGPDVPSGCKLGDTVKIEGGYDRLWVSELVIIPKTVGMLMR